MKIEHVARPVAPGSVERRNPLLGLVIIVVVCGLFWGATLVALL